MKKNLITLSLIFSLFAFTPSPTFAIDIPAFSTCSAPTGEVIANYSEGIHGIVGETAEYTGSDVVYKMNEWQIVQCYCPPNASQGIETVWWKYQSLNETDVSTLVKQGWVHIPTGKVWGLDDAPYLAKNTRFECRGNGASGNGGSSGDTGNGTGGPTGYGEILGITSLADTGSQQVFVIGGMILCGVAIIALLKRAE